MSYREQEKQRQQDRQAARNWKLEQAAQAQAESNKNYGFKAVR